MTLHWCWNCHDEPKTPGRSGDIQPRCPDCNEVVSTI